MNGSGQYMSDYQTEWRRNTLENQEPGIQNEKSTHGFYPENCGNKDI